MSLSSKVQGFEVQDGDKTVTFFQLSDFMGFPEQKWKVVLFDFREAIWSLESIHIFTFRYYITIKLNYTISSTCIAAGINV